MTFPSCSIDDCGKPIKARGWCQMHYYRWRQHGDPLTTRRIRGDHGARFWSKVNKDGPLPTWAPFLGPCWLWTSRQDRDGYGRFAVEGKDFRAHRFAYKDLVGPIPDGLTIDHLCRVPGCVNPAHMEPVTAGENKRRANHANGSRRAA